MSDSEAIRGKFAVLRQVMNERVRRLWAAAEADAIGWGGISRVSAATGLSFATIATGLRELRLLGSHPSLSNPEDDTEARPPRGRTPDRVRRPGSGRKPAEVKDPAIISALERLLAAEEAGDPMGEQRWVRSSLRHLSDRLAAEGHSASAQTVARLLKDMGFSLRTNKRKQGTKGRCPKRDEQFRYIAAQKQAFTASGLPVISVDTKKRELIGNFFRGGRAWARAAPEVLEHDFPSHAECSAVPFGVYDTARNTGFVVVGMSHNTPEFAVTTIAGWWQEEGRPGYPKASHLLILADGGGSNGSRSRAWKLHLQKAICNRFGLTVSVCHYPPGCSKWNPVEHRLFSQISRNWEGKPLRTLELMLGYIRGTTTAAGLMVRARLDDGTYRKGEKVTKEDVANLCLRRHEICEDWNYTINPAQ